MELYLFAVWLKERVACSAHQVSALLDWLNLARHCSDFLPIQITSAWRRLRRRRFLTLTSRNRTLSVQHWKEKASWLMFCSASTCATSVGLNQLIKISTAWFPLFAFRPPPAPLFGRLHQGVQEVLSLVDHSPGCAGAWPGRPNPS